MGQQQKKGYSKRFPHEGHRIKVDETWPDHKTFIAENGDSKNGKTHFSTGGKKLQKKTWHVVYEMSDLIETFSLEMVK